jgi:hypothetical protein
MWCAPRIALERAIELGQLVGLARKRRLHTSLLVLTAPDCQNGSLQEAFSRLFEAWRVFVERQEWRFFREKFSLAGWVYGAGFVHVRNAWAPRVYVVVLSEKKYGLWDHTVDCLTSVWCEVVRGVLGREIIADPRQLYYSETIVVREFDARNAINGFVRDVSGNGDSSHSKCRSPWAIARSLASSPYKLKDKKAALWNEWQRATYDRQPLTWSEGACEVLGRNPWTNEECAAERTESGDVVVAKFTPLEWQALMRAGALSTLLDAAEIAMSSAVYDTADWILRKRARGRDSVARIAVARWQHERITAKPPFVDLYVNPLRARVA